MLTVLALAVPACGGPTERDVIERNRGAYQALKRELDGIVTALPTAGSVGVDSCAPAASFDGITYTTSPEGGKANTIEFVMERTIRNPSTALDPTRDFDLDILPRARLKAVIELYERPLPSYYLDNDATEEFTNEIEGPLAIEYLAISRVLRYKRPAVFGTALYQWTVSLESFLIRMADKEILCSFRTAAESDREVHSFTFAKRESTQTLPQKAADDDLVANARMELSSTLTRLTGYRFELS
ncbi:hypothetical protein GCM10027615_37220 [Plantactinospora veratri]